MTPQRSFGLLVKGHPSGGLFLAAPLLSACALAAGCATSPAPRVPLAAEALGAIDASADPLTAYGDLGFLVGDRDFPAVGRLAYLPASGDSTFVILGLSLPNRALRFRRQENLFLARYRVQLIVGDSVAPLAVLDETESVRVRSFRETSRRDESVIFQGMLRLAPGTYPAHLTASDLASRAGFARELIVEVPRLATPFVTAPVPVYVAEPRSSLSQPPQVILDPRATAETGQGSFLVYIERAGRGATTLEAVVGGEVVWAVTLPEAGPETELGSDVVEVPAEALPPGALVLRSLRSDISTDSTLAVVTFMPGWIFRDYEESLSYLRYAGTPEQLDDLRSAVPRERARVLQTFLEARDPDPDTPENEFFEKYFRRIREADSRFGEAGAAGWLTDRGAVYIALGPPDQVLSDPDTRIGSEPTQVWRYDQTLGFELRLVFVDQSGFGSFVLTIDSRRAFRRAVERLYS